MNSSAEQEIKKKFGNYITIYRPMLLCFGPTMAHYLNELVDYHERWKQLEKLQEDGSFYFSSSKIEDKIGLDKDQQYKILKKFKEMDIISTKLKGLPAKNYFYINFDKLLEIISQSSKTATLESQDLSRAKQDSPLNESNNKALSSRALRVEENNLVPKLSSTTPVPPNGGNGFVLKKRITEPIEKPSPRYRTDVMSLIEYWNNSPGLSRTKTPNGSEPTKAFLNLVGTVGKVLDGKFYSFVGLTSANRMYKKEEVISSIDRFKLAATNPHYLPQDKRGLQHLGMSSFFYNPYSNHITSHFLKYIKEEPKPLTSMVPRQQEKNPQLTAWLKEIYLEKVLHGLPKPSNPVEENKFIVGANQLHETIRRLQPKLNMMTQPREWCKYVIDSLMERWAEVYPGHISSDYTYTNVLPRYLKNKGRLE